MAYPAAAVANEFIKIAHLSLEQQLDFLASHLEVDIGGNHLVRNIRALLWAGRFFSGPAASRWQQRGRALLAQELDAQILADGFHFEVSAAYRGEKPGRHSTYPEDSSRSQTVRLNSP